MMGKQGSHLHMKLRSFLTTDHGHFASHLTTITAMDLILLSLSFILSRAPRGVWALEVKKPEESCASDL